MKKILNVILFTLIAYSFPATGGASDKYELIERGSSAPARTSLKNSLEIFEEKNPQAPSLANDHNRRDILNFLRASLTLTDLAQTALNSLLRISNYLPPSVLDVTLNDMGMTKAILLMTRIKIEYKLYEIEPFNPNRSTLITNLNGYLLTTALLKINEMTFQSAEASLLLRGVNLVFICRDVHLQLKK